jgi:hypothetical protein
MCSDWASFCFVQPECFSSPFALAFDSTKQEASSASETETNDYLFLPLSFPKNLVALLVVVGGMNGWVTQSREKLHPPLISMLSGCVLELNDFKSPANQFL